MNIDEFEGLKMNNIVICEGQKFIILHVKKVKNIKSTCERQKINISYVGDKKNAILICEGLFL